MTHLPVNRLFQRSNAIRSIPFVFNSRAFSSVADASQPATTTATTAPLHVPVMLKEVIKALNPKAGQTFIDMTFGAGGHTRKILQSAPNIKVIALDQDADALQLANQLAAEYPNQVTPLHGRFSELPDLLKSIDIPAASIDGILFDFGCSSMQFDRGDRGFSLKKNGPLDMRMNRDPSVPSAADVLAKISEIDLYKILKVYGEEKKAKKIARAIIDVRYSLKRIETTHELAAIVASCFEQPSHLDSLYRPMHNATKTFQAIRIFVNNELNEINYGMHVAEKYLKPNGRLVTLSFHSMEDTIVKRHISGNVVEGKANAMPLKFISHMTLNDKETIDALMESNWKPMYKHVLTPSLDEIEVNPRSRSAKLRAAFRIPNGAKKEENGTEANRQSTG